MEKLHFNDTRAIQRLVEIRGAAGEPSFHYAVSAGKLIDAKTPAAGTQPYAKSVPAASTYIDRISPQAAGWSKAAGGRKRSRGTGITHARTGTK